MRLWWLWKYRNSKWCAYYCAKLPQTEKEKKMIEDDAAHMLNELKLGYGGKP
jgi:hypothetical protein